MNAQRTYEQPEMEVENDRKDNLALDVPTRALLVVSVERLAFDLANAAFVFPC